VKGIQCRKNWHIDESILEQAFMMACNALIDNRNEIKERWETHAEFGNTLEQYIAIQIVDRIEM
jgi:hypothetical protein